MLKPPISMETNVIVPGPSNGIRTLRFKDGNYVYICTASVPGEETDAIWSIQRIEYDGDDFKGITWACGISNQVFKASERNNYEYK